MRSLSRASSRIIQRTAFLGLIPLDAASPCRATIAFDFNEGGVTPGTRGLACGCDLTISNEITMRTLVRMAFALATILSITPATAQRYDPSYSVCLRVLEAGQQLHRLAVIHPGISARSKRRGAE
jgi:hypothetical protein